MDIIILELITGNLITIAGSVVRDGLMTAAMQLLRSLLDGWLIKTDDGSESSA